MFSRGTALLRTVKFLKQSNVLAQPIRNSSHHWSYRTGPPPAPKGVQLTAEIVAGIAWWWILWHLITEYEHITGEFEYPDARKWTDAELGIPPE